MELVQVYTSSHYRLCSPSFCVPVRRAPGSARAEIPDQLLRPNGAYLAQVFAVRTDVEIDRKRLSIRVHF